MTARRSFAQRSTEWIDRFAGSDPGLNRLRLAVECVLCITVALVAEATFVSATHALQMKAGGATLSAGQAAAIAAQNHGVLVIGMMLGAVIAMIGSSSIGALDTPRKQLLLFVIMPAPMIASLAIGLALSGNRTVALISFVVFLAAGAYCRRFGPFGFVIGLLFFMGDFFGFFLNGAVTLSGIGWLAIEVGIGVLVTAVIHFALFYPNRRRTLRRLWRSYAARSHRVAGVALALIDSEATDRTRAGRRLQRHLARLNESALMVDAQLADLVLAPKSTVTPTETLQRRLFDAELMLANLAEISQEIVDLDVPHDAKELIRQVWIAAREEDVDTVESSGRRLLEYLRARSTDHGIEDPTNVALRRFGTLAVAFAKAFTAGRVAESNTESQPTTWYDPPVALFSGWLPGSATVSATASKESGPRWIDRVKLAPYARVAIQMAVAVSAAILLGSLLSERRFYWAVIAVFVSFMGTNNRAEQINKSFLRVMGTLVGIILGATLTHFIGNDTSVSIAVILVAVFLGMYLLRVSYLFMTIGITVMVSQLYVQLSEFSDSLLVLRLEETALGAAVAIATVLLVVPLRTGHVIRVATREHIQALADIVDDTVRLLVDPADPVNLRGAARALDASYHALSTTVRAARPFYRRGDGALEQLLQSAATSRRCARNLVAETPFIAMVDRPVSDQLQTAAQILTRSMSELADALEGKPQDRSYVRAAALLTVATSHLEENGAATTNLWIVRNLQLIDAATASIARSAGMTILDADAAAYRAVPSAEVDTVQK